MMRNASANLKRWRRSTAAAWTPPGQLLTKGHARSYIDLFSIARAQPTILTHAHCLHEDWAAPLGNPKTRRRLKEREHTCNY
eukprot:15009575-Alexandrium_andersonii.AAC.1